jgi:hypothetical protein
MPPHRHPAGAKADKMARGMSADTIQVSALAHIRVYVMSLPSFKIMDSLGFISIKRCTF